MVSSSENSVSMPNEKKGEFRHAVVGTTLKNEKIGLRTYGDGEDHDHEPAVRYIGSQVHSKSP